MLEELLFPEIQGFRNDRCAEREYYGISSQKRRYTVHVLEPDETSTLNRRITEDLIDLNIAADMNDVDDIYAYFKSLHGLIHKACEGINIGEFALSLKAFRIIQLSIATIQLDSTITQKPLEKLMNQLA